MLYVSFIEIFVKSKESFIADGSDTHADLYATGCFFAGMAILRMISFGVHLIDPDNQPCIGHECVIGSDMVGVSKIDINMPEGLANSDADQPQPQGATPTPVSGQGAQSSSQPNAAGEASVSQETDANALHAEKKRLQNMGLKTAAAIMIHNFPEGLATFVATLADPKVGATLAIAIAIHNIPEGLCVAMPIYQAWRRKHMAFLWALLSGVSEPIGALIGWLLIKGTNEDMNQKVYGILFGVVAGMMVMVVCLEILPVAFRYDPQDKCVTNSISFGMLVMAASLCLFGL